MTETEALNTREAAEVLGLHPGTLANWRNRKLGPPYLKIGRAIRYRRHELEAWCNRRCKETMEVNHE